MLDVLVGGFYGDEGKGKVASYLAFKDMPEIAVRTGGTNAGHTIVYEGKKYGLRTLPSAFLNGKTKLAIGPGALIRREVLYKELEETKAKDRLIIDPHTAVITEDEINDEKNDSLLSGAVGSTLQGVGYAESKRVLRKLKLAKDYPELSGFMNNVPEMVLDALDEDKTVHIEGTQGHFLSLFHGEYPYVTSRNTTSSGVLSEAGIGPKHVDNVIVIFKAFITRVGGGPLEGELSAEEAKRLGIQEFGTVTGRMRRVAHFNAKIAKGVARLNSANQVAITKLDIKFKEAYKVREWDRLPEEARKWVEEVEQEIGVPVTLLGTGEEAMDIVDMREKVSG
ncbi:MAG TPA: adenylosuccinate synthetase [Candidatus Saccharimonadales bacterium]|nr:adenylosuccinate synthetase [Candidatus Saccharimonadales bacterium]